LLFNSFYFALFMLPVLVVYPRLKRRGQNLFLLAASYFFYGSWDWRFLSLIMASTVVDYLCALRIEAETGPRRRRYLLISLGFNLGLLGVFKYFNFFMESLQGLLGHAGLTLSPMALEIILPVGISFYTFQTLSYTIDVYQRQVKPTRDLADFALYVAFFPQLVAGPIEKARRFLPQVLAPRTQSRDAFFSGCYLIFWGLFKKVFVADNCALIVDQAFRGDADPTGFVYLIGAYAFSWQIYCDFSGYSDIARGVARLLGFDLMLNFNMPYLSPNLADFWRRWHISLSTWFKEYLYIPLGGNRVSKGRLVFNLMTVFVVSGLWHGAATNFIVWGALHGAGLVALTFGGVWIAKVSARVPAAIWTFIAVVFTFHYVALAFAIWQTETSLAWVELVYRVFFEFGFSMGALALLGKLAGFVALPFLIQWLQRRREDPMVVLRWSVPVRALFYVVCLFCMLRFGVFDGAEFIYFQF